MKVDGDVSLISAEAPIVFARACEMFILELTLRSWNHTEENKRRTPQKNNNDRRLIQLTFSRHSLDNILYELSKVRYVYIIKSIVGIVCLLNNMIYLCLSRPCRGADIIAFKQHLRNRY